jgi:ATP-binding cassette, subfamily B, bacterial
MTSADSHLETLSLAFFTGTKTGEIQSRLANDVGGVQTVVTTTASSILANVVIFVSTIVAMIILSWQLTIVAVFTVPAFFWLTKIVGDRRRKVSRSTQESLAAMSAISEETLSVSGVLLAKVFGNQGRDIGRYQRENQRLADLEVRQQMIGQGFYAVVQSFLSITPALVYLIAGLLRANGQPISAGTIVAFTTLQTRLYFPIGQLLQVSVELRSSLALFDRVFEYLDLKPDIVDAPDAVDLVAADGGGRVALRSVYFRFAGVSDDASTSSTAAGWRNRGRTGTCSARGACTPTSTTSSSRAAGSSGPARAATSWPTAVCGSGRSSRPSWRVRSRRRRLR